jgi:hypothetical protein
MSASQVEPDAEEEFGLALEPEIAGKNSGKDRQADATEILGIVQTIIDSMNRDVPSIGVAVRDDLEDLACYIQDTKSDIMNLNPEEISEEHPPSAGVELNAIDEGKRLEGPQSPDAAVSQDDIDPLFDSL